MEIRTERLLLRPVCADDAGAIYAYAGDPENTRYMVFLPYASLEETAAHIREAEAEWAGTNPAFLEFVILWNGAIAGGLSVYYTSEAGVAELGWVVNKAFWGRGFALEAAKALISHGRQAWGWTRVIAQCDSENTASRRVMEKLGMQCVSRTGGRKNRSSDEERTELTYELVL